MVCALAASLALTCRLAPQLSSRRGGRPRTQTLQCILHRREPAGIRPHVLASCGLPLTNTQLDTRKIPPSAAVGSLETTLSRAARANPALTPKPGESMVPNFKHAGTRRQAPGTQGNRRLPGRQGGPRTLAHHDLQELDDDLGGRAQQDLALAPLLRVVHGLQGVPQHADLHHGGCRRAPARPGGPRRRSRRSATKKVAPRPAPPRAWLGRKQKQKTRN